MTDATAIQVLIKKVDYLTREVKSLKEINKPKPHWASATELRAYTGWSDTKIKDAVKYKWVVREIIPGKTKSYKYDLNSIEKQYLNENNINSKTSA